MTHRKYLQSIYISFKKHFHKEKGHFTSEEKATFCVIFKVGAGGGGGLPLGPPVPMPLLNCIYLIITFQFNNINIFLLREFPFWGFSSELNIGVP